MKTINAVQQTFFTQLARRCIVPGLVVTLALVGGGIGAAEEGATRPAAKDQRAAELDAKISDIGIDSR